MVMARLTVGADQTWTGKITDSTCGNKHIGTAFARKMSARDCTQACARSGSTYVFAVDEKIYKIANQRDPALALYAGQSVTIAGELQGETITISTIREPAKSAK